MGKILSPLPVKLVIPMFSGVPQLMDEAEVALTDHWGPIDYHSPDLIFAHTDYYEGEFGRGLLRRFVAFERLVDPGMLAQIKLLTNALEQTWSEGTRRRINLDPGYVSEAKLVLATTKNHGHRVYIGQGIYAEVTLTWRDHDFRPWPWTYPDYRSEAYLQILRTIRGMYRQQLKTLGLQRRAEATSSPSHS